MKIAYMNNDNTVREIIPNEATPIDEWYNAQFALHCMEVPDHIEPNWEYDSENDIWYEPGMRPEQKGWFEKIIENGINDYIVS